MCGQGEGREHRQAGQRAVLRMDLLHLRGSHERRMVVAKLLVHAGHCLVELLVAGCGKRLRPVAFAYGLPVDTNGRSEEHTSELQSRGHLVCRLLLEPKQPTST